MSRYVDADAIEYHEVFDGDEFVRVAYGDDIDELPSADVVEVVHGENIGGGAFECSICGFKDCYHDYEVYFCPHCGADMRGEEDAEIY